MFALVGGALIALAVGAAPVYRWMDADGITHFSQQPPPPDVSGLSVNEIPAFRPRPMDPADDYWSIANQVQRLEASRIALEQRRLEQKKLRQERAEAERRQAEAEQLEAEQYRRTRFYPALSPSYRFYPHAYPRFGHGFPRRHAHDRPRHEPSAHHRKHAHGRDVRASKRLGKRTPDRASRRVVAR